MRNLTLTLKKKLILAFVLVLGITGLVIFLMVNANTKKVIINGLIEQLKVSQKLGNSLLDAKYPGNWAIRDGMLYKGDMLINGNFEVVDEIKKQTGRSPRYLWVIPVSLPMLLKMTAPVLLGHW